MHTLSRVLTEMYGLAEEVPLQAFPRELLRLLKEVVSFEGAILGKGRLSAHGSRRSSPYAASADHNGIVIVRTTNCLQVYRSLARDPVDLCVKPVCADCCQRCSVEQPQQILTQEREVMLVAPSHGPGGDWLAICRDNDHPFDVKARAYLREIWPHLVRALAMNRKRHLEEQLRTADGRAAAVVTQAGYIDIADAYFRELLSTEWPGFAGDRLPPPVLAAWRNAHPYRGPRIEIQFREQNGALLCIARPHTALAALTKTEGIVARHFASGLSHREVAQTLGVSENTVRTHLKQAYSKLGVHDKAQLANRIGFPA